MGRGKHNVETAKFLDFIRSQYCCVCGGYDRIDKFGDPRVTVSHITARGSANRQNHFNNVVPMCMSPPHYCHQHFEGKTKMEREKYRELAVEWTERWNSEKPYTA